MCVQKGEGLLNPGKDLSCNWKSFSLEQRRITGLYMCVCGVYTHTHTQIHTVFLKLTRAVKRMDLKVWKERGRGGWPQMIP